MTVLVPPVGPLVAARSFLLEELGSRGNDLPVGVVPPRGEFQPYVLLSRPGGSSAAFLGHYLIRVRVFDTDAVRLERNTDLIHRLLVSVAHKRIDTPEGPVWVTGASPQMGPSDFTDPVSQVFAMQMAVFWTLGLHRER